MLDHVVFAEPDHAGAKALLADALEQLGFGSENGTWRASFLSGAIELRSGNFGTPTSHRCRRHPRRSSRPTLFFDAIAVQVNGPKAWDLDLATRWAFPDHDGATYRVTLQERRAQLRPRRARGRHADDHRAEGRRSARSRCRT